MDIQIVNIRNNSKIEKLKQQGYQIVDVTSKSKSVFSPFYPHGDVPIPGLNITSMSVEGIWQGLKVFELSGPDNSKFKITNMKNIKRTTLKNGFILGHKYGKTILEYHEAREQIYIPSYNWVLENKLIQECNDLLLINKLVLLDYDTNENVNDLTKPLSHASLIKKYLLKLKIKNKN